MTTTRNKGYRNQEQCMNVCTVSMNAIQEHRCSSERCHKIRRVAFNGVYIYMNMLASPLVAYAIGLSGGCGFASNCRYSHVPAESMRTCRWALTALASNKESRGRQTTYKCTLVPALVDVIRRGEDLFIVRASTFHRRKVIQQFHPHRRTQPLMLNRVPS